MGSLVEREFIGKIVTGSLLIEHRTLFLRTWSLNHGMSALMETTASVDPSSILNRSLLGEKHVNNIQNIKSIYSLTAKIPYKMSYK